MFAKKMITAVLLMFSVQGQVFGFVICNLTDSEKVLEIQEAYRPRSDKPGNLASPIPLDYSSYEVSVPAHSSHVFSLREPCSVLLVSVITTKTIKEDDHETVTKSKSTTCYTPYSYQGLSQTHITDDWGLVIHKPIPSQRLGSPFDRDYAYRMFTARQNLAQGYGIKCLHPNLLETITSLEDLPEELAK